MLSFTILEAFPDSVGAANGGGDLPVMLLPEFFADTYTLFLLVIWLDSDDAIIVCLPRRTIRPSVPRGSLFKAAHPNVTCLDVEESGGGETRELRCTECLTEWRGGGEYRMRVCVRVQNERVCVHRMNNERGIMEVGSEESEERTRACVGGGHVGQRSKEPEPSLRSREEEKREGKRGRNERMRNENAKHLFMRGEKLQKLCK
jgi:hypothetical protein